MHNYLIGPDVCVLLEAIFTVTRSRARVYVDFKVTISAVHLFLCHLPTSVNECTQHHFNKINVRVGNASLTQ